MGLTINIANSEVLQQVMMPDDKFVTYFDSDGYFTVVGEVSNRHDFPIKPTVTIEVQSDSERITKQYDLGAVKPMSDFPFKIKFPEVKSQTPTILNKAVSYTQVDKESLQIQVLYDKTLVLHDDGHISGRITNTGNTSVSDFKIYALIYGKNNQLLDMGVNIEDISTMKPGEIREFSIYPDPSVADKVEWFSCFVPADPTPVPMTVDRNGEKFSFRYLSGAMFAYGKFVDNGKTLIFEATNSYPLAVSSTIEIPQSAKDEKFSVFFDEKPIEFIQSIDESGNWHVSFMIEPYSTPTVSITGFGYPPTEQIVPASTDKAFDELSIYATLLVIAVVVSVLVYKKIKRHDKIQTT